MKNPFRILIVLLLLSLTAKADPPFAPQYRAKRYGFSYAASGVVSFFSVDERHSEKALPRAGMGGMVRMLFYPSKSVHIHIGLEVMSQACAFNTYYFAPGHSQFYDRSFGYTHTLRTVEMYLPIMARIGLSPDESSARTIFYLIGGYSPKVFLSASANVVANSTGQGVWGGGTELEFENWFIAPQTGNVLIGGFGFDKRLGFSEKFVSFEFIYRYNLSRFIYNGQVNTNELLIKNSCLSLQVGYRFAGGGGGGGM